MRHDENIDQLLEATAYDRDGDKIGGVSGVYLDDQTSEPMWVTINTGLFGLRTSFAPLAGSSLDGDRLTIAHDKDTVKDAPNVDEDGHITRSQEDELYTYYQVDTGEIEADRLRTRRWDRDDVVADGEHRQDGPLFDRDRDGRGPVGEVLDGPDGDRFDSRRDDSGLREGDFRDRRDDLEGDPAYRNDPAFIQDQAAQGGERYVDNERLQDQRHDEPGLAGDYAEGDLAGRPDAADGPVGDRRRGADPIDGLLDDPDADGRRNI